IRMLPFGGKLCDVQMSGQLLNELLAGNNDRQGLGGYLQLSPNLQFDETRWLLKGSAIIPSKTYLIVVPEYLLTGLDKGLEFLKEGNPGIKSVRRFTSTGDVRSDIRLAVVRYLVSLPLE
ncbi:MAG: 5'-nucleotidase C-terminal domain-containing protein, partial [Ferruginibacter sp.]